MGDLKNGIMPRMFISSIYRKSVAINGAYFLPPWPITLSMKLKRLVTVSSSKL